VWVFSFLSYLQTPPAIWFGLGLIGFGFYLYDQRALSRRTVGIFAAALVALIVFGQGAIWSPYQRLQVTDLYLARQSDGQPVKVGYTLNVQQVFYQRAVDLSPQFLDGVKGEIPEMEDMAFSYNLPYRLRPAGSQVLIVGAGMGNDAAAALRNGASHIDAVEIDPAILALGRKLHPELPYGDSRVSAIVDDARSFFKNSAGRYDVVAFGLLDSHTLLSGLSSVRLDSFVYTLESFQQVREHLKDDGVAVVTFAVSAPWIEDRLGRMLVEVFGDDQVYVHAGAVGTTFVAGRLAPDQLAPAQLTHWRPNPAATVPLTTDDWPYLYLRTRQIPAAYWQALLLIAVVCLALIARSFPEALRPNWHFWLLGAAFLLIEFKSITELALLFGTTWLVNSLAISGVLMMALAANVIVLRAPRLDLRLIYVLLFASLALTFFFPLNLLVGLRQPFAPWRA
jgi:SAM-dependent methyltransferase